MGGFLRLLFGFLIVALLLGAFYILAGLEFPTETSAAMQTLWSEMKWNLLTLIIDVVVVVLGVSYVIGLLDDKKWEPARRLVSENGTLATAWMAHAGYHCFITEGVEPQHQVPQMRAIFLNKFISHINRFEESIHLCNAGLGKELMPLATEAVWKMKQIVPIYSYLFFAMEKQSSNEAFMYEVPKQLILEVHELGLKIQEAFESPLDAWFVNDPQKTIDSITDFVARHHHIYLPGTIPRGVNYNLLHVYDTNMLRTVDSKIGIKVVKLFTDA
ncbi:hypothetical protein PS718_00422 [Pseudomonas fluorescens]|uniref:Uncharacterized protein n=1 Tax=Pseudomonas fluorescens TaxID=294 RepID=A0A5E6ZWT7_PSEFL|nr:hypothetical protein [Pseudomonas fluorescens]VVN70928.1 hypothetical protein PS718_00422 [Pseudomonas fluorescens]